MKKIMFNDKYSLTTAVLEGRKTMTRRLYSPTKPLPFLLNEGPIAIAQPYKDIEGLENMRDEAGYNNKMFVKANIMPHWITITDERKERLQDISDEDCLREGIIETSVGITNEVDEVETIKKAYMIPNYTKLFYTPKAAFATLIDKVSGKGTWKSNPYVIVYTFQLIK